MNRNEFGVILEKLGLNGYGVEIGVSMGNYSEVLLSSTKLSKIYFIDPWKEYPRDVYNDNTNCTQEGQDNRFKYVTDKLKKYGDRACIIRKDSIDALRDFSDGYFDFVYIDANHAYEYVKIDINNWYPKVKVGGIFAGHDYMNAVTRTGVYGVKQAVDEFCKNNKITPLITEGSRRCPPSWYLIKEK